VHFSLNNKKYILKIQKAKDAIKKNYTRATIKINKLYDRLNNIRVQMKKVSDANLRQILENCNVPKCQLDLMNEIFKVSKLTNPKNRRYTEN
jgi:division protein CdvB (Snf7/Vps24/ESCRT-III family)